MRKRQSRKPENLFHGNCWIFFSFFLILSFSGCTIQYIKRDILISSEPAKKPDWVGMELEKGLYYRGVATGRNTREEAVHEAYSDAIKKIAHEVGVNVEAEFEMKKEEDVDFLSISVKSKTSAKAQALIQDAKCIGTYIEKYERKRDGSYYYNAWVLVKIPEGEIERARERMERYCKKIIEKAENIWKEAEKKEKENPYTALHDYKSIKSMMLDVKDMAISGELKAEVDVIRKRAEARIEELIKIKDPMIELENLKGNRMVMEEIQLTDEYGSPLSPPDKKFFDEGECLRIKIKLNDSAYIYIIGYDKSTGEPRLLFPNKIDFDNLGSGERVYPESTAFVAERPEGSNTIFIIASKEKINIPEFGSQNYLAFTKEQLWDFINRLKRQRFDIAKMEIYIR